jgi:DNA replication and repair protein RecF
VLEIEINPGRSNRGRINKSPLPRARELLGLVRTVVFSPEDLALVKGDPSERRHFADDLLVQLQPRYAGVRTDYDRVLKQRNSLLKSARPARFGSSSAADGPSGPLGTLGVWDANLARLGAEIVGARMRLVADLSPLVGKAYEAVARGATRDDATMVYRCSFPAAAGADQHELEQGLLSELERLRGDELDRGISLAGPHRDDLVLSLGDLPAKGYASHGESWSFALALRLASYDLLRSTGDDPILVLDDVFAELDTGRRQQLAELVGDAEQVLVTAAVADDVPVALRGTRYTVADGTVTRDE